MSILLNISGDELAMITCLDGYPMAQHRRADEALPLSGAASFIGAFFDTRGLFLLAPQLVKIALLSGPAEYFALFTFAVATLGVMSPTNQAKSTFSAALGIGFAIIGVAAPGAGNNVAAGGALVLGVPRSGTTAVWLSVLLSLNIAPGPRLFTQNPDMVWGLIAALFIANFMLLAINIPRVGILTRMPLVPPRILMPIVMMVSLVVNYGISGSPFDLLVMIGCGVLGWVCAISTCH